MAQVSYGTITITDTNDIESIVVEYNRNQSTTTPPTQTDSGWSTNRPAWAQGYYIWQRTRTHKSGTSTSEDVFGNAVCITGSTGQTGATGQSLSSTKTQYTNAASNVTITTSNHTSYTWTDNVPAYNSSKPVYWCRVTNTYVSPSKTEYIVYKDQGTTDAIKTSNDANTTAAAANSTANTANQTANEAKEIAQQASTDVTNLQTRTKYFWTNLVAHTKGSGGWTKPDYPVGTFAASGISGTTFDYENSSTYGYNTLYSNGIKLRYNAINLGELTGSSLTFYRPSTTSQGSKGMELTSSTLKFFDATGTVAQATFGGTQATISGTINVYDGKIGNNSNNYWYIGNYTDYNQNTSAIIKSIGTASIQLNETNTWRISTNRIHTAWAPETGTDAFKLHFPKFNDSSSASKYWDYGLHLPTNYSDKFLYIRNASGSESLENLLNDLDDAGYNYWDYKFYVDGDGNLHAGDIYSHDVLISGTSAPYLLKSGGTITGNLEVNGTLTKGGKNVAYFSSTPTSGQILVADGTSGSIKTSGYTIAKSVPSNAVFTDQYVQTVLDNSKKLYLTGTQHSGTYTGTLNYNANVYVEGDALNASTILADSAQLGDLIVTGAGRFANGLYGDLIGNADTATKAAKVADSGNGNDITFGYSKSEFATPEWIAVWNGYELRGIHRNNLLARIGGDKSSSISDRINTTGTGNYNWTSSSYDDKLITSNTLAYWNGAYNSSNHASNIEYVKAGKLGDIVTHNASEFLTTSSNAASASKLSTAGTITTNLASTTGGTYTNGGNVTAGITGTLGIAHGGTGATTAQNALWNIARSADPGDLNNAKRMGVFKISNTTTNAPWGSSAFWGTAINITDDRAEGNTGTAGSTWQFVVNTSSTDVWLRRITNTAEWTSWTKFYSTSNKPSKSDVGLGNVTNNAQVKGLSSGTTSGHFVTWGSDGYTVADSGITAGNVVKSVASNSSGQLVLTYADNTTSDPIDVEFVATQTSSIQKAEALNVNGAAVGGADEPVYFSNQGKPTKANKIPKLNNATTGGTFYAPTGAGTSGQILQSSGGTPSWVNQNTIAAGTATKFNSTRKIELTGDVTGSASSDGSSGWSIGTLTSKLTPAADNRSVATTPNDYNGNSGLGKLIFQGLKANGYIDSPSTVTYSYLIGLRGWADSSGGKAHELAFNDSGIFTRMGSTTTWDAWRELIDSTNYTDYTVTKTGTGASGTWGINITGSADSATSSTNATNTKYLMNRGANTVTISDSSWNHGQTPSGHTNRETVWKQKWTQSGITYTPSGGSATANTDSADLVYWLSSSNTGNALQVNMAIDGMIYALGGFKGNLNGNASTATTATNATNADNAATANKLLGFSSYSTSIGWGNQTGTPIMVMNDSTGGSVGFRRDNPNGGQTSMVIDGTVYIKEGQVNVGDAIKTITRSGTTFTYTTLWGGTGTFTQQDSDTKNTAGSTNTSSEIYLIGATSQVASPQTYSHDTARVRANGNFVGTGYELATSGAMSTTKAKMVYDSTLDAIMFIFE